MNPVIRNLAAAAEKLVVNHGDKALRYDEFIAASQLMEITWHALWNRHLMLVVAAVSILIAVMNPVGIAGIEFTKRLALCAFVGLIMTIYSVIYGTYIVVHLARYQVPMTVSPYIGALVVCLIHNPMFLAIFPESDFLSNGYWLNFCAIYMILSTISCGVTFIFYQNLKSETEPVIAPLFERNSPDKKQSQPEDLQRLLTRHLQGSVMAITVEDNYVRVETTKGDQLLHLSLAAAISMLADGQGIRVHRSIWLNWAKMERVFYENGNPRLQTKDGHVWPVSRSKVEAIKLGLKNRLTPNEPSQSLD